MYEQNYTIIGNRVVNVAKLRSVGSLGPHVGL